MSSSVVDQTLRMNGAATQNGNAANGTGSGSMHPEQHLLGVTDFGIFNDEIQNEMANIKKGWSGIDQAFDRLHKIFRKNGRVVSTVKERYGDENDMEQKIKALEEQKKGFADVLTGKINDHKVEIDELKSQHNTDIGALRKKHDKDISKWKEEAVAGDRKRKQYEELEKKLIAELAEQKSNMEKEFREEEKQMKEEITGLKKVNESCQSQLESTAYNLDRVRKECQYLKEQNNDLRAPYLTVPESVQHYADQYKSLFARIEEIAETYFETLPEEALNQPFLTSVNLIKADKVFDGIPITPEPCSRYLRLAAVQNIIYKAISNSLWKPWFCGYLCKQGNKDQELIQKMFDRLGDRGENERQNWKISTLRILGRLDDNVNMAEIVANPVKHITTLLKPLVKDHLAEGLLRTDLTDALIKAVELGKKSRGEKVPILTSMDPNEADGTGWKEYLTGDYERSDPSAGSLVESFPRPLLVSPLVYREVTGPAGSTARRNVSHDGGSGRSEVVEVIYPGMALFSDTGILEDGAAQSREINNAAREKVFTLGNGGRRNGVSSTASSPTTRRRHESMSAVVPALTTTPSERWGSGIGSESTELFT